MSSFIEALRAAALNSLGATAVTDLDAVAVRSSTEDAVAATPRRPMIGPAAKSAGIAARGPAAKSAGIAARGPTAKSGGIAACVVASSSGPPDVEIGCEAEPSPATRPGGQTPRGGSRLLRNAASGSSTLLPLPKVLGKATPAKAPARIADYRRSVSSSLVSPPPPPARRISSVSPPPAPNLPRPSFSLRPRSRSPHRQMPDATPSLLLRRRALTVSKAASPALLAPEDLPLSALATALPSPPAPQAPLSPVCASRAVASSRQSSVESGERIASMVGQMCSLTEQVRQAVRENEEEKRVQLEQKDRELNASRALRLKLTQKVNKVDSDLQTERQERQKLKQRADELEKRVKCVICLDKERCVVFQPCFHLVACQQCHSGIAACPICRAVVDGHLKVRLA